jgi:hypothetical protein
MWSGRSRKTTTAMTISPGRMRRLRESQAKGVMGGDDRTGDGDSRRLRSPPTRVGGLARRGGVRDRGSRVREERGAGDPGGALLGQQHERVAVLGADGGEVAVVESEDERGVEALGEGDDGGGCGCCAGSGLSTSPARLRGPTKQVGGPARRGAERGTGDGWPREERGCRERGGALLGQQHERVAVVRADGGEVAAVMEGQASGVSRQVQGWASSREACSASLPSGN